MDTIFPMLEVMQIPPKPRTNSMLLMSEIGIPLRQSEDICEVAGTIIDYAKITDHAGMSYRLSADWLKKKIRLYNSSYIQVIPGGIPFQLAVQQNKVSEFLKRVQDVGFVGVEMSEDVIEPLEAKHREDLIAQAKSLGLAVYTEMGRKNRDRAFDVDAICEQILRDIQLGVSKVYLESAEIQEIYAQDPAALDRIAGLGKNEYLLFELGLVQAQEKAAWLVERYGPGINFASVAPADVVPVDAIRRGLHRKAHFTFMTRYGRHDS
jgi:phosphosulfolactate synthase (CoM biosynthesis protein A)